MITIVRKELSKAKVQEVDAIGKFTLPNKKLTLFPGSVYGFFVKLTKVEAKCCLKEAIERQVTKLKVFNEFKPIEKDFYVLYWGKDKSIGKRAYEHIGNPVGTGSIRLSTFNSLKNKEIHSFAIIVDNNDKFETHLQSVYPHLLLTTKVKI